MSEPGHNLTDGERHLLSFFQRWLRLEEQKQEAIDDLKELFAEAKALGFTPKAMRVVFREQMADETDRQKADELEALCDLYRNALAGARPAHTRERAA